MRYYVLHLTHIKLRELLTSWTECSFEAIVSRQSGFNVKGSSSTKMLKGEHLKSFLLKSF